MKNGDFSKVEIWGFFVCYSFFQIRSGLLWSDTLCVCEGEKTRSQIKMKSLNSKKDTCICGLRLMRVERG